MIYNRKRTNPPTLPFRKPEEEKKYAELSCEEIMEIIKEKCGSTAFDESYGDGEHTVFFLPEAADELKSMVSYGRRSPMNIKEMKFIGLGHFFKAKDERVSIVVSHFLQIFTTNRTSVSAENLGPDGEHNPGLEFLEYYRNEFLEYEKKCNIDAFGKQVDPFLSYGASEYVLEGHTHPDLGVFWSSTDRKSGMARAAKKPVCIFVCDPVRKKMLGCIGSGFENARVIVVKRQQSEVHDVKEKSEKCEKEEKLVKEEKCVLCSHEGRELDELCTAAGAFLAKSGCRGKLKCRKSIKGGRVISFKMTARCEKP